MDVATDSTGNALLYGTTTGSLYRYNTALEQDIFLLSVARVDGAFNPPINVDEDDMPSISPTTLTSQVPTMATSDTLNSESPSLDDTTIESSGMPSSVSSVDSSEVPTQMSSTVTGTVSMGSSENRTSSSGDKRGHNIATVFLSLLSLFLA